MTSHNTYGFHTRTIHAGEHPDEATGAHGTPIYQSNTFALGSWERFNDFWEGKEGVYGYSRDLNPTVDALEKKIADLEGAAGSVAAASGMAAISSAFLATAASGHAIVAGQIYNTANKLVNENLPGLGIRFTRVDMTDLDAVEAAFEADTRIVYTECFSNPGLVVADIEALATIAHRHGALLVIDNTFLSPAILRPLEFGADLVLHSATKYLAGHGEVLGGVISGNADLIAGLRTTVMRFGGTLSAMSAWLIMTGMKTLPLRMERHSANAMDVARFLSAHPMVEQVHYPGLPDDPGHETANRLTRGSGLFGGMMSMTLRDGAAAIPHFAESLKLFTFATSLGDTASLCWPIYKTDVVRLSVGLEDVDDLLGDLDQALGG
ncbi:MAG: PLP-dependent transferase [Thermomicrobiales bacterium]|nr:PLP-dependent transferase [Thermomicrobiales bacterium]